MINPTVLWQALMEHPAREIVAGRNCRSGSGLVVERLTAKTTHHRSAVDDEYWEVSQNRFCYVKLCRSSEVCVVYCSLKEKLYVWTNVFGNKYVYIYLYVFTCLLPAAPTCMKNVPVEPQALVYMLNICVLNTKTIVFLQSQTAWFLIIHNVCICIFLHFIIY